MALVRTGARLRRYAPLALLLGCADPPPADDTAEEPLLPWYDDADGDGFGDPATEAHAADRPGGWVGNGEDCDDADPDVHPDADERCDGIDQDCDGIVDEDPLDPRQRWTDADGDGFGDPDAPAEGCEGILAGDADCDDADPDVHPEAEEVCGNGVDDDCDGSGCAPAGAIDTPDLQAIEGPPDFGIVLTTGDLDGDGAAEIVAGARHDDGSATVWALADGDTPEAAWATFAISASSSGNSLLSSLVTGDFDGDGSTDVVAGVWDKETLGESVVLIHPGPLASGAHSEAEIRIESSENPFGAYVDRVPDSDGDGADEIVVGVPGSRGSWVIVTSPPAAGAMDASSADTLIEEPGGTFGREVVGLRDLDGDGLAEVAAGDRGRFDLFFGPLPTGTITEDEADATIDQTRDWQALYWATDVGDTDGDGRNELLALVPDWSEGGPMAGAAFWFETVSGAMTSDDATARILGAHPRDELGSRTRGGGDVDGDGFADVLLGAPECDEAGEGTTDDAFGQAWLLFGPLPTGVTSLRDADARFRGAEPDGLLTEDHALALGDLDGDGAAEVLLGAPALGTVFVARGGLW